MKNLLLSTRNAGKMKEIAQVLGGFGMQVLPLPDDAPPIEETGETFAENACLKAETIMQMYGIPVLADDSGLIVDALQGAPGVYSARFAGPHAADAENTQKLLEELNARQVDWRNCTARFEAVLAFARPGHKTEFFHGSCEGRILPSPRGEKGFGYDPVFYLPELNRTMAELSVEEKNRISHRARALQRFVDFLRLSGV